MHMAERQWPEAATDFFEAFKNYDEAGNQRRIQCLKYALFPFSHCSYSLLRPGFRVIPKLNLVEFVDWTLAPNTQILGS